MKKLTGVLLFAVVFILIIAPALKAELVVTPLEINLDKSYGSLNSNIFTVMNTGVEKVTISAQVSEYSDYLRGFVAISPEVFTLEPGAKRNIQVNSTFSGKLSPERHDVMIDLVDAKKDSVLTSFDLFFTIPGEQISDLVLNDAKMIQKSDGALYLEALAENRGNIIARGTPKISISQAGIPIPSSIAGQFRVLPGEIKKITLPVEAVLTNGTFQANVYLEYAGKNKKTVAIDSEFEYEPAEAFKTNSKKEIMQGELFIIKLTLNNNESFDSRYSIEASVDDSQIANSTAGTIPSEQHVNTTLTIDTTKLFAGNHMVKLKVSTGKNLEKSYMKEIMLKVNMDMTPVFYLAGFIALILLISLSVSLFSRSKRAKATAESRFEALSQRLDRSHVELEELIKQTEKFIDESNEWIIRKHGDEYAFK